MTELGERFHIPTWVIVAVAYVAGFGAVALVIALITTFVVK